VRFGFEHRREKTNARQSAKPHPELAFFLKFLRRRIDRDVRVLGPYVRLPQRLGKRVTQEELAEAIGVGREWYVELECGSARARASIGLVRRLADALTVTPEERASLFQLALPDVGRVQLRDDSIGALEGYSRLRSMTKRLWTATSTEDVLTTAIEQIADWFDGALLVRSTRRPESAPWEHRSADDKQDRNTAAKVIRDMREVTPQWCDAAHFYPRLANAGDLGSQHLWPLPLQRANLRVWARYRVDGWFAMRYARVRSRTGFVGGLYLFHELGHSYSAADLAVLRAIAELASLALS
jgi:transcriptional regulator with XRE-family HTH domain